MNRGTSTPPFPSKGLPDSSSQLQYKVIPSEIQRTIIHRNIRDRRSFPRILSSPDAGEDRNGPYLSITKAKSIAKTIPKSAAQEIARLLNSSGIPPAP